jgi:hypothetical protein
MSSEVHVRYPWSQNLDFTGALMWLICTKT